MGKIFLVLGLLVSSAFCSGYKKATIEKQFLNNECTKVDISKKISIYNCKDKTVIVHYDEIYQKAEKFRIITDGTSVEYNGL
ncbi:hypothetical protein CPG37_04460 [Malaciobacter canalis]|uniref:DUF2845 domain-containing protein n=1 Tax=Malaciobacter canalis TaxID=1912871 RepID=A0ABX4LUX0_9BACT|nr:hypothetical protein [Malaciobacter canalis]PHO10304.1 hypothetical protein CPG37_04460 [Malaciobacter canalis]QEE32409.1 hypothetical protein ACAN_0920 [Malaciobacter canalis]